MSIESIADTARTVMERCALLGTFSEEADRLTRPSLTAAMRKADEAVAQWMRDAQMQVQQDAIGNLFGRYESYESDKGTKTLLLGSHLDSVRDAGCYDGPLGVLIALACVERLQQRQQRLPFAIEVVGFTDEEGLRFHNAYLGSRMATGQFEQAMLSLQDSSGITIADAITAYGNTCDPAILQHSRWQGKDLLGYCEVHIEQGPVLETENLPVGVVAVIVGQSRIQIDFIGTAGHAGTVPMQLRRDALCGAAEFVLAAEGLGRETPGLVTTVGQADIGPGASNVIPGHVHLSLDVRHQDDAVRLQACQQLHKCATEICQRRQLSYNWHPTLDHGATRCDAQLMHSLEHTIAEPGYPVRQLTSGAGHDAVIMSAITPIAMLFVRCKGGISHHPDESVTVADVGVAIDVLERFLLLMSQEATL